MIVSALWPTHATQLPGETPCFPLVPPTPVQSVTSGRSLPSSSSKLSSTHQVAKLKPGSVCVDLALPAGGNIVGTVKDEKVVTENGVTIIGYSDLNSPRIHLAAVR